jgi:hypothetical protein
LFGSVDRTLGHLRRFSEKEIDELLKQAGFTIESTRELNKAGKVSWWWNSKVLGAKTINKLTLKIFDKTVWLWRALDGVLPWRGLSLIVTAKRSD